MNVPNAFLPLLARLVAVDSPTGSAPHLAAMADTLARLAADLGLAATVEPELPLVVVRRQGRGRARPMLVGHMDTVYPAGEAARRPLAVVGDRAFGPGVCDMKGGLVLGLLALRALPEEAFDEALLVVNADEEQASPQSRARLAALAQGRDRILVLEPGREDGQGVLGRRGVGRFLVTVRGREAHAGVNPDAGVSAIHHLARLIARSLDAEKPFRWNVGRLEGGTQPNVVAATARAYVDVRTTGPEDEAKVRAWLDGWQSPPAEVVVEGGFLLPPWRPDEASLRFARRLTELAAADGWTLGWAESGGGSDANHLASAGLPLLDGLGPEGGAAHSPDEYLVLPSVARRLALLERAAVLPLPQPR